jgi:hypothetical protein
MTEVPLLRLRFLSYDWGFSLYDAGSSRYD